MTGREMLGNQIAKATRGIMDNHWAQQTVFSYATLPVILLSGIDLEPGKEKDIELAVTGLMPNSNVKRIVGKLTVVKIGDGATDTDKEKQSHVQGAVVVEGDKTRTFDVSLTLPEVPSNLSLSLGGGEVFWSHGGQLGVGTHYLPDFAEYVNTYLDSYAGDREEDVKLKFKIKSDTPGRVDLTIDEVEYAEIHAQSWENPMDGETRQDKNFQLDFNSTDSLPLLPYTPRGNENFALVKMDMDVAGEFGEERMLGSTVINDGREFATISSEYSLAQGLTLKVPVDCVGIGGCLQANEEAEIYIEIQGDKNGTPATEEPLAMQNMTLASSEDGDKVRWSFGDLETPVRLEADTVYWLVIKGVRGKVLLPLKVQDEEESLTGGVLINRGGEFWRRMGSGTEKALLRLLYLPGLDNHIPAVTIGIKGSDQAERLDPGEDPQLVSFVFGDADSKAPEIIIRSYARGTLSIANVIEEYTEPAK